MSRADPSASECTPQGIQGIRDKGVDQPHNPAKLSVPGDYRLVIDYHTYTYVYAYMYIYMSTYTTMMYQYTLHVSTFLQDLPNEIIHQILSTLYSSYNPTSDPTPRLQAFLNIGRVCRRLRKNAERFIYRAVDVGYCPGSASKHKRPWQLIRTLIARPYLAAYIRNISITWSTEHKPRIIPHERSLFTAAASKLGLELAVRWEGDQALLLCHMLRNVETLIINYPSDFGPNLVDPFGLLAEYALSLPAAPGTLPLATTGMQGIHTLVVSSEHTTTAHHIIPMLLLPNLRSFTGQHIISNTTTGIPLPDNPAWHGASRVTHMRLLACELHGSTLAAMFRIANKIKHLEYDDAGGRFEPTHVCDETFTAALKVLSPTLQYLMVNLAKVRSGDGTQGMVGSLRDFPLLREMACNHGSIWRLTFPGPTPSNIDFSRVLPAALETIEIWLPWHFIVDWLGELLKQVETSFKFLKTIKIYPMGRYGNKGKWFIKRFKKNAEKVGVKVGVAKMAGDRYGYRFS
ncbi:hypothetical protein DFP73DRAFT_585691 [Morchella snyderi]|nr:hypothetical protein DFP73DRAFT_585691 [Morchella snyderi]